MYPPTNEHAAPLLPTAMQRLPASIASRFRLPDSRSTFTLRRVLMLILIPTTAFLLLFHEPTQTFLSTELPAISPSSWSWLSWGGAEKYADGMLRMKPSGAGPWDEHPLLELVARGKELAAEHSAKRDSVNSLASAVLDYQASFGMDPPEGFDAWYDLATELNATRVPSLIPLAHESVLPFLSMPPRILRSRAHEKVGTLGMMGFRFIPETEEGGRVQEEGLDWVSSGRYHSSEYPNLLDKILGRFPQSPVEGEPLLLTVWTEDNGFRIPSGKMLARSRELARRGLIWNETELLTHESELESEGLKGWGNVCDPPINQMIGNQTRHEVAEAHKLAASFIADPQQYMDVCKHPEHLVMNGEMIMKEDTSVRRWEPLMASSRLMHGPAMLGTPTSYTQDIVQNPRPWVNKTDSRLFFRGGPTGIFHTAARWDFHSSHRDRLSSFAKDRSGEKHQDPVLVDRREESGVVRESWDHQELVTKYLDVGLVQKQTDWNCGRMSAFVMCYPNGGEEQLSNCPNPDADCDMMKASIDWANFVDLETSHAYKYRLDVDGYGWSGRWRKELSTNSVIFKVTLYPEWWSAQMIPWYHYVPAKYDYSDLFDIMAFFAGSPDGAVPGRDDLAEEIAAQGRAFAMDHLRWEDMQSYMFLFLLEYRRAWADDREAATFQFHTS